MPTPHLFFALLEDIYPTYSLQGERVTVTIPLFHVIFHVMGYGIGYVIG